MGNLFSFSFSGRVELLKHVYFCAQKSIIKAENNMFQDLINAPRICGFCSCFLGLAVLFYFGTPWAFHIIIMNISVPPDVHFIMRCFFKVRIIEAFLIEIHTILPSIEKY